MKMMSVLFEVVVYIIFVYLLMFVSYGNRDPISHKLYTSLYQEFHDAAYVPDDGVAFEEVKSQSQITLVLTTVQL